MYPRRIVRPPGDPKCGATFLILEPCGEKKFALKTFSRSTNSPTSAPIRSSTSAAPKMLLSRELSGATNGTPSPFRPATSAASRWVPEPGSETVPNSARIGSISSHTTKSPDVCAVDSSPLRRVRRGSPHVDPSVDVGLHVDIDFDVRERNLYGPLADLNKPLFRRRSFAPVRLHRRRFRT